MILTYHNFLGKTEDHHGHPNLDYLNALDLDNLSQTFINFKDDFALEKNSPINNTNWNSPAYTDTVINLTNESFHYSDTIIDEKSFRNPGPYITEKTFKPLLAGRAFLVIGQADTYKYLNNLGFNTNFGFNITYDNDPGDLNRIKSIFKTIDKINSTSISELHIKSLEAVIKNFNYIKSRKLDDKVMQLNSSAIDTIKTFFE
jgi:hypothetical protein